MKTFILDVLSSFRRSTRGCRTGLDYALHPIDGSHRPVDKRLAKDFRKLSRRFAKASKRAADKTELRELTYVVLSSYAYMARECNDPHYHPFFEQRALEAQVDLSASRLEELKMKLS